MEFKPEEIAKLVLGYLRENKCQAAFLEFLSNSPFLKEQNSNHRRGKYVATRLHGLSLTDYLVEYALVYSIVQEHIEASDYYNERGLRTSLSQQLLYLLTSSSTANSRTSTPIQDNNAIIDVHVASNARRSKFATPENNLFEIISGNSSVIPVPSCSDNSSPEFSFLNSTKSKSVKVSNVSTSNVDPENDREKSQEMCKEIFTQTFLDNSILIEKLADNINKEVSARDRSNIHNGQEFNNTAIETIIQRIATDPIVINSIEEIIGNGEEESENPSSTPNLNQDKIEINTSKERNRISTPKKTQNKDSSESIKTRLRSSKKCSPIAVNDIALIEEQNNEVVQSIIAASSSTEKQRPDEELITNNTIPNTLISTMGDVILGDQLYDNFVPTETIAGSNNQNQIYINTGDSGNLLMVQPSTSSNCPNVVSTKTVPVDPPKPYYIFGNQQFGSVLIPQTPYKISNLITEQDIMAMPTIIMCDNNQPYSTNTQTALIAAQGAPNMFTSQNRPRAIAPRKSVTKAQSLSEYISLYQCNDPSSPIITREPQSVASPPNPIIIRQLQSAVSPPNPTLKSKAPSNTTKVKQKKGKKTSLAQSCKSEAPSKSATINPLNVLSNNKLQTEHTVNEITSCSETESDTIFPKTSETLGENVSNINPLGESMPQILTPKMMIVQDVKERRSRSTPRNGSHVRQLDFSTPDKWGPIVRRANTSPKPDRMLDNRETPVKTCKPGSIKSIRTSLFKSPDLEVPAEESNLLTVDNVQENDKTNTVDVGNNAMHEIDTAGCQTAKSSKSSTSWDADLRALAAAPPSLEESVSQKPKRKRSADSMKKHVVGKQSKEILNNTEDEAAKIEIALSNDENQIDIEENVATKAITPESTKNIKKSTARRQNSTVKTKKTILTNKKIVTNNDDNVAKKTNNVVDITSSPTKVSTVEEIIPKLEPQKMVATVEASPEKQYSVINRHVKSRIKKKCNMENPIKKTQMPDEIILTNITKIKSCEIIEDTKNKLILSPSKLNANKRTLVEMENRSPEITNAKNNDAHEVSGSKFITPELVKSTTNIPPSSAKRNIMPILETPIKIDCVVYPKTPSLSSPCMIDTPFTKAVLDQLTGVDISGIPTPKFPITPNVPFTPIIGMEQSPLSNRATDYSTSSSYYQPSDTEQNKSLEQLIEECRKLDRQSANSSNKVDDCDGAALVSTTKHSETVEICEDTKIAELNESGDNSEVTKTSVTDKMKAFNQSMMGKKNLQLVKMFSNESENEESSSNDSSSTGTSTSSSENSDSSDDEEVVDKIVTNETPTYSLRSRKVPANTSRVLNVSNKEKTESQNTSAPNQKHSVNSQEAFLSFQEGLLQEMEEKRQRTIARFKTANSATKPKQKKQAVNRKETIKAKSLKVSEKSKKLETNREIDTKKGGGLKKENLSQPQKHQAISSQLNDCNTSKQNQLISPFISTKNAKAIVNNDKEIVLHLSSDEENLEPSKLVEAVLLECTSSPKPIDEELEVTSTDGQESLDQETETSVKLKGLLQMGIHLIPNKSVKKSIIASEEMEENVSKKNDQCEKEEIVTTKDLQEEGIEGKLETSVISPKLNVKPAAVTSEPIQTKPVSYRIPIKHNRDIQKTETREKLQASKHKLNRSLEEGELLSDDDKSPRKDNKYKKCKTEDVGRTKCKSTSSSLKNISSKESRNQQNRLQELRESIKYPPHVVDRSRDSIPGTSSSSKSSSKNKISDKNTKLSTSSTSSYSKTSSKYKVSDSTSSSSKTSSKYKASDNASSSSKTSSKYKISHSASSSSKSSSKSKIPNSTSSSSKSSSKNEIPDKSTKISTPNISSSAKTSSKNTSDNTTKLNDTKKEIEKLTELNNDTINQVNELDYELQFANKVYTEETHKILTHDYSKVSDRTLSDYNLEILTKKFSANVYIAEIDAEVEKSLTITPFEFLVDIPSAVEKQTAGSSKPNKSHLTNEQSKNKITPLNILYNQLVKPADETARSSLLENLYEPTSTSRDQKRTIERVRPKIMDKNKKSEKSETNSSSKHKNKIEENSRDEKQSADKILEDRLTFTVQEPEAIQNKTAINLEGREPSINVDTEKSTSENAAECSVQDTKHSPNHIEEKLRVIDGVIMLNASKDEKTAVLETSFEANDDLMNYALVGSDRVENSDGPALDNSLFTAENSRKRKMLPEEGENQHEKKQKTEELLRGIDVDMFLKKLHGET